MTQSREDAQRIAELNSIFLRLNDRGRDSALSILRALNFAQSVMSAETGSAPQADSAGKGLGS